MTKNIQYHKRFVEKEKKQKPKSYLFLSLHLLASMLVIFAILFYVFLHNKSPKEDAQKKSTTQDISKTCEIVTDPIELIENGHINKQDSIQFSELGISYFENFKSYLLTLQSHVYHNTDPDFNKCFTNFIYRKTTPSMNILNLLLTFQEKISNYTHLSKYNNNPIAIDHIYQNIVFVFYQILNLSKSIYEWEGIDKLIEDYKEFYPVKIDDLKIVYQQTTIKQLFEISIDTINQFKEVILYNLESFINNKVSTDISKILSKTLTQLKNNMFVKYNKEIDLIYNDEKLIIPHILNSFEHYKKFLVFNYYIVFLHLFEIDNNFKVVAFRKGAKEAILKIYDHKSFTASEEDEITNRLNKYVEVCKDLFNNIEILETAHGNELFGRFFEDNSTCNGDMTLFLSVV